MIKTPIIISENGDLSAYGCVEDAEQSLEAVDVRNGEYEAYDSEGKRLLFEIANEDVPMFFGFGRTSVEVVKLQEAPTNDIADGRMQLDAHIRKFLGQIAPDCSLKEHLTLEEIISILANKLNAV